MRGLRTLLIERRKVAAGTSSRNQFNLVSGVRYVVCNPEVAAECQRENHVLRRIAPHLIGHQRDLFVCLDHVEYCNAAEQNAKRYGVTLRNVSLDEATRRVPYLPRKIYKVFETDDTYFNAVRFCHSNLKAALQHGATFIKDCNILAMEKGKVVTTKGTFRTRFVVNAAGFLCNQVARLAGFKVEMVLNLGAFVLFKRKLISTGVQKLAPPGDGDAYKPLMKRATLGTTSVTVEEDAWEDALAEVRRRREEIVDYLKEKFSSVIPKVKDEEVLTVVAGIRPLVRSGDEQDGRKISRRFVLIEHSEWMLTITGGKLVTSRLMAERAVDVVCRHLGVEAKCKTADVVLP